MRIEMHDTRLQPGTGGEQESDACAFGHALARAIRTEGEC